MATSSTDWPLEAEQAAYLQATGLCTQLWQQGGLTAKQADALLATLPTLASLLQPITSDTGEAADTGKTDPINVFCLTAPLLKTFANLSNLGEWQLTLLGLNTDVRAHWVKLAAVRCREAGVMSDPQVLVKLISHLGNASEWVLERLERPGEYPRFSAGPLAQAERELLGNSLNDNAAIPALCRILRACFTLNAITTDGAHNTVPPISAIDSTGKALAANWCAGRLLALPNTFLRDSALTLKPDANWLLTERPLPHSEPSFIERFSHQPWNFLLSLLVFVQDAWAAEQRGGLLLNLPSSQNAFAPTQVDVAVQGIEGDEASLGTLADFLLQVLAELNIALYPTTPDVGALNRALSPLIGELLSQQIWQFKDGGRGEPGHYRIHPDFSDACYRLPLAPVFSYKSAQLQQAFKRCALITSASAAPKSRQEREISRMYL